jgi:hypothetical protein
VVVVVQPFYCIVSRVIDQSIVLGTEEGFTVGLLDVIELGKLEGTRRKMSPRRTDSKR